MRLPAIPLTYQQETSTRGGWGVTRQRRDEMKPLTKKHPLQVWTPGEIHEAVQHNWIPPSVRFVDVSQICRQIDLDSIVQAVAELPNRTSPDDWPEAMLVTADELKGILSQALRAAAQETT